jgi:hypothetical protein
MTLGLTPVQQQVMDVLWSGGKIAVEYGIWHGRAGHGRGRFQWDAMLLDARDRSVRTVRRSTLDALSRAGLVRAVPELAHKGEGRDPRSRAGSGVYVATEQHTSNARSAGLTPVQQEVMDVLWEGGHIEAHGGRAYPRKSSWKKRRFFFAYLYDERGSRVRDVALKTLLSLRDDKRLIKGTHSGWQDEWRSRYVATE